MEHHKEETERQANILKRKREEAERNRQEELKRQAAAEIKRQAELKLQKEEAELKHREELERQAEKNRKREEFKSRSKKHYGLILESNFLVDPNTDLMWTNLYLDTLNFKEILKYINVEINCNERNSYKDANAKIHAGYTDWRLPTVEEFETLEKTCKLINKRESIFETMILSFMNIIAGILLYNLHETISWTNFFILGICAIFVGVLLTKMDDEFNESVRDKLKFAFGGEYWISSSSIDEQHGQVCCRVNDKIVSRHVLKSEKHRVILVRKF